MTIKKLIWKLRKKTLKQVEQGKEPNGAYGVLESWYANIIKLDPRVEKTEKFQCYYNNITGMIWGLMAVSFITDNEGHQLLEELNQIMNRFYRIEEE